MLALRLWHHILQRLRLNQKTTRAGVPFQLETLEPRTVPATFFASPPTLSFQNLDNAAVKTGGPITVVVALSAPVSSPVTVQYATSDNTAQAGVDYLPAAGTLAIPTGSTTASFTVSVLNDGVQTGDLRLNLTLSNPTNIALGFQSHAVATVVDTFPSDNQLFISGLNHDLLQRPVDGNGLGTYLSPLLNAETPLLPGVLYNFVHSLGYYERLVGDPTNGFYSKYLGDVLQPGDPNVDYWGNQLLAGASDEFVASQFVASVEYYDKKGHNDNLTWLQSAYQDVLGRPLDVGGQAFYMNQLGSGNDKDARQNVARQLLVSDEAHLHQIDGYYATYLNRPTNENDRQYWLNQFKSGQTDEGVIVGIGGSLEGLMNNGGTNAKWVTSLYLKTLGRLPSADESNIHLNILENNASFLFDNQYALQRFFTAQALLNSDDYLAQPSQPIDLTASLSTVIQQTYFTAFGREANAGDLSYWSSQFAGNPQQKLDVASAIFASGEHFNATHLFP